MPNSAVICPCNVCSPGTVLQIMIITFKIIRCNLLGLVLKEPYGKGMSFHVNITPYNAQHRKTLQEKTKGVSGSVSHLWKDPELMPPLTLLSVTGPLCREQLIPAFSDTWTSWGGFSYLYFCNSRGSHIPKAWSGLGEEHWPRCCKVWMCKCHCSQRDCTQICLLSTGSRALQG